MSKTRGINFSARQSFSRQQLHGQRRSEQSIGLAAIGEPKSIFLLFSSCFQQENAKHASGSKNEGSEPNLHRLMDETCTRPRSAKQSRVVVATKFSNFLKLQRPPLAVTASVTETLREKTSPPQAASQSVAVHLQLSQRG